MLKIEKFFGRSFTEGFFSKSRLIGHMKKKFE